jgi:m7GpppX diphosphatase
LKLEIVVDSFSNAQLTDQAGRRIALLGKIKEKPALLILERAPFVRDTFHLQTMPTTLRSLKNLGANDIYYWYMACSGTAMSHTGAVDMHEDLKINLIYPCTEKHIKKYSEQGARMVTETAEIYEQKVRPYMAQQRDAGRLQWVWNIIDGKTEVEDVIYRTVKGVDVERGFLLLPDLNWDRKTIESLHLLGLIERMDIWSVRDLKKKHVPWLKEMRAKILEATVKAYPAVEEDQLKLYIHYQPTYYHFHIHIVHVKLESGATQATGKAMGLDNIISQLEHMAGDEEAGMHLLDLTYGVGEASELWTEIFEPIKNAKKINNVTEK